MSMDPEASTSALLGLSDTVWAAVVSGAVAVIASTVTTWVVGNQNRKLEEARWAEARRQFVRDQVLAVVTSTEAWARSLGKVLLRLESAKSESEAYEALGTADSSEGGRWRIGAAISALRLTTRDPAICGALDAFEAELNRRPSIVVPAFDAARSGRKDRAVFDEAHRRSDELEARASDVAKAAERLVARALV